MAKDLKDKKKGIMSLFFEEVPKPESTLSSSVSVQSNSVIPSQGELDKDIYTQLMKVLADNNMDGYDYFEFRSSLENMKTVVPAEGDRFKAAFAAVSSIITVDKLISSAEFYLQKLSEKKNEFEGFVQELFNAKVSGKEAEAKKIKDTIVEKTQQLAKINEEINKLQEISTTKINDATAEKAKIDVVKNNFNTTFDKVITDINSDKSKIQTYLNQGK